MPVLKIRSREEMKAYLTKETDGHEPSDTMVGILYGMVEGGGVSPVNVLAAYGAGVLVGRAKAKEEISTAIDKLDELRKKYTLGS